MSMRQDLPFVGFATSTDHKPPKYFGLHKQPLSSLLRVYFLSQSRRHSPLVTLRNLGLSWRLLGA